MTDYNLKKNHRHFIDISSLSKSDCREIIEIAKKLKAEAKKQDSNGFVHPDAPLKGQALAMIFEKPSTRTRVSFEMAMHQLGGKAVVLQGNDMQLGRGESISDTAKVLSGFVDAIMLRANSHEALLEMAETSRVPIINALTNFSHPCQIMADVLTFEEHSGSITGKKIAWSGDGNNVAVSWIHAAVMFDCELALACPKEYSPLEQVMGWARNNGGKITLTESPKEAIKNADCVITDTFISMGDDNAEERLRDLAPYQVNADLMNTAKKSAIFMHCLPAHRDEEVTADVIDGPQSVIWDEAENRLHIQKAILMWCFGKSL
ncbi:MAG: ornithine carbamoyltransferase [Kordiimonadaceae bacterium]|nr:ornithine carbamoyltransferase [Kordiimonadaceae bacterium]